MIFKSSYLFEFSFDFKKQTLSVSTKNCSQGTELVPLLVENSHRWAPEVYTPRVDK